MKLVVAVAVATAVVSAERVASADQCALVTKKQAELANTYLGTAPGATSYALFCEPCGDKKPRVGVVQSVSVRKAGKGYSVQVNGSDVDLAYVYVDGGATGGAGKPSDAVNVGLAIGCRAQGVTKTINMGTAMWGNIVPKPTDAFERLDGAVSISVADSSALDGTWTAETSVVASTCASDKRGTKTSNAWTITTANGRVSVKSDSGLALIGSLLVRPGGIRLTKDGAPSQAIYELDLKDGKTLAGVQVAGQATNNKADPVCVTYRSVSATKVK